MTAVSESRLLHDVLRAFGRGQNFRLSRHNVGVAKHCSKCESVHRSERHPAYRMVKYGIAGAPDIIGILGPDAGRTFGIECKAEDGRVSEEQAAYHAMITKYGGLVRVVRSMSEAETWMKEIGAQWK